MKLNYEYSLAKVLEHEGGYTNDAADPGGPTNFGITIIDYRKYVKKNATSTDIRNMKLSEAKAIYRSKYWDAMNCDALPSGVDYCVFDYGVNSGIGRSAKVLQKFSDIKDPVKLINAICDERMAFLRKLKTFSTFGRGWTRRVSEVRSNSIKLATDKSIAAPATAMGVMAAGGAALTQTPHEHWPYVVAGTAATLLAGWGIYHWYNNRTANVSKD